jgi:hypothetical protein
MAASRSPDRRFLGFPDRTRSRQRRTRSVSAPVAVRDVVSRACRRVRWPDLQKFNWSTSIVGVGGLSHSRSASGESPRPERTEPSEQSRLGVGCLVTPEEPRGVALSTRWPSRGRPGRPSRPSVAASIRTLTQETDDSAGGSKEGLFLDPWRMWGRRPHVPPTRRRPGGECSRTPSASDMATRIRVAERAQIRVDHGRESQPGASGPSRFGIETITGDTGGMGRCPRQSPCETSSRELRRARWSDQ